MRVINITYQEAVTLIKREKRRVIVYGAGMIGQVIVPYLIETYNLCNYVDYYVDVDKHKQGTFINIGEKHYEIKSPDFLNKINGKSVIFITNSKFDSVIHFLDEIPNLNQSIGLIIPIMQIYDSKKKSTQELPLKNEKPLIPKTIHYCWFGGKDMPTSLKKCIKSWEKCCPDYNIVEWNEKNYDIGKYEYTQKAYTEKKYSFVTDMVRLDVLYEHGGIYFDTDVFLKKNIDKFLQLKGFVGTEKWGNLNSGGGCGFVAGHHVLKELIEYRKNIPFILPDGTMNLGTNGLYETAFFLKKGYKVNNEMQMIDDVLVLPSYINHPYDYVSCELDCRKDTVSVHYFSGGWMEKQELENRRNTQIKYKKFLRQISEQK